MASPQQGPPRKPVTVIHFPKVGKSPPAHRPTVSITELKAVGRDEDATDPHVVVTPEPKPSVPKGEKPKGRRTKTHDALPEAHVAHVDLKKHHSPKEAADLAALGHKLFENGKLEEARVIFEKLVGADTRDAFVHTMLGTVYLAMNAQEKALALFQAALKLDPDDLAAVVYRGEIRLNRGKFKAAMEDLMRAVTLAPATDPFVERAKRLMRMAKALGKKKSR
jgi:tetratricopeptide (TPR) repeat protein